MNITLYRFSKRVNSTKRPSGGASYNVRLKGACSIEAPVFLISGQVDTLLNYNYAYAFNHYYFINDIVIVNEGMAELYCSEDVLATYKTEIGNYTAYVERSASNYDKLLFDDMIKSNGKFKTSTFERTDVPNVDSSGCYILRVADSAGSDTTGIATYVCNASQLKSILGFLFSDGSYSDILTDGTVKTFFNPFQYILSLVWYPYNYSAINTAGESNVFIGWWDTGVRAPRLGNSWVSSGTFELITPVMESSYIDDFRGYASAWSEWYAVIPGTGLIPLSGQMLIDGTLSCLFYTDLVANNSFCELKYRATSGLSSTVSKFPCNIGAAIQISQVESTGKNLLSAAFSAASLDVGGVIRDTLGAFAPTVNTSGVSGSSIDWRGGADVEVGCRWVESKDIPLTEYGRPLKKNVQLSTLSGYVQCANASIPIDALDGERQAVNGYLNGGFFYE